MRKGRAKAIVVLFALISLFILNAPGASAEDRSLVRSIIVKGNDIIDTEMIKTAIVKTKLNRAAVEQELLDDIHSIYDLGYFQDVLVNLEPALGGIQVVFQVVENPTVSEFNFSGLSQVPLEEYTRRMKTQIGNILNVYDLGEDLYGLREWIAVEYGYLTRIAALEGDTDGRLYVEFAPTRIKEILIEGNEKTKDFVIERELSLKPGDLVNIQEIDRSLRRVLMLGFFEEISRDFSDESDPDQTVLTINLKESKTGAATFGVSYNHEDRLVGFLEAADENFLGRGQRVNATLQFGKRLKTYELGFYEPYFHANGTSLGVNLYRRKEDLEKEGDRFELVTRGGDLTLGRPLGENSRGRLTLRMEDNKFDYDPAVIETEPYEDYKNQIVGFGYNTNTVDHPFNPTEGLRSDLYLEMGVPFFKDANSSSYSKLLFDHSHFFEVKDGGYVLALRGLSGRLLGGTLKDNEKFKIGGADTLRGYSSAGEDSEERALKGDHMLVMNAEFRFPIVEKVTGILFTDWGTAWKKGQSLSLDSLNNSFGLGVRLDTPLGLLRLDYGFGKDENDQRAGQFYFGIGQTF